MFLSSLLVISQDGSCLMLCLCVCLRSAWLKDTAHPIVGKLDERIHMLTGLNVQHPYGEYLQVVNYGIGGHYEPHFDHATVNTSLLQLNYLL